LYKTIGTPFFFALIVAFLLRSSIRKISPDVKVTSEQIKEVILKEVLKREVIEGDKADEAKKKINKVFSKISKSKVTKEIETESDKDKTEVQNIDDKDVSL